MWTDEKTTQVFRIDDGSLVDWDRVSAALNSAISGCLELGNKLVVSQTIDAVFGDSDVVHCSNGWLNRAYVGDAWLRIVRGVASPGDCDALRSLFFCAFGEARCSA